MSKKIAELLGFSMALLKYSTVALLVSLLAACDAPGTARLRELCITESFPKIHKRVSAAGYYDGFQECFDAIRFLVDWDYQFVECREKKQRYISAIEPGLYRISKVSQSSGLCNEALLEQSRKQKLVDTGIFSMQGLCFALDEIEKPEAKYGVFVGDSYTRNLGNVFGSKIHAAIHVRKGYGHPTKRSMEIESFMLFPVPSVSLSSFASAVSCRDIVPELVDVPGLASVNRYIIPTTPGKESTHGNNRRAIPGGTAG